MHQTEYLMASPLNISPSTFIKVSGVRVDRGANISDSGKQVWALIERRTALLYRKTRKNKSTNLFLSTYQYRKKYSAGSDNSVIFSPLVLASPVFVDTEVLGNFHCSRSIICFLHIVIILPLLLLLRFSCRLQFCSDSDEQLGLHGSPQLRCFNHSHCQERTYGNKGQIQSAWLPDSPTMRTAKKQQIRKKEGEINDTMGEY